MQIKLDTRSGTANMSGAGGSSSSSRKGVVGGGKDQCYRFTVLGDGLLRMEWAPDCVFEDRPSVFAVCRDEAKVPEFQVKESDTSLEIITSRFHLNYNKKDFSAFGLYALVFGFTRSLWRYKEGGQPNLGGTYRTLDDVNGLIFAQTGKEIEIEEGILSQKGYALLDDSKSVILSSDGFIATRRPGEERVDCYLFAYGHSYRAAIKAFHSISGPPPLLPRWALGNWWSRYYAYSADSYLSLMDKFREQGIPLSVGVLDMDWHLVNDPRVIEAGQTGWTGYTWNKDLFPDPPAFIEELHKRKLKTSLNDHPADGVYSFEDKYPEMARAMNIDPSTKEPVLFNSVDRAYMKAYFDIIISSLEEDGTDFWWLDWQQGPYSLLKDIDPLWVLNHFHFLHSANKKLIEHPMIFSRYAGPGSHRYPVGFSGDTHTTWASLDAQPEFTAMASNIGYGWWSHDIGGHMHGTMDHELTTRWVQFGVLSPIMRLHSTHSPWVTKEPWRLPAAFGSVVADFLRLRHRLIPYLQTMNHRSAVDLEPLMQPMYWEYPEREEAYRHGNQYLYGTEMLVIPITKPQDAALGLGKVKAWLPPGTYVDWFTGCVYEGDRELWLSRQLHQCPVFMKQGSIVPLDAAAEPENGGGNPAGFELIVVVGADGSFELLEEPEDGETSGNQGWDCIPITFTQSTGTLHIGKMRAAQNSSRKGRNARLWSVRFLGVAGSESILASVEGQDIETGVYKESNGVVVNLGEISSSSAVTVQVGSDPQLRANKPLETIEPILRNAQISYAMKDDVWAAVSDEKLPVSARMNRLEATDMNSNLRLFITECLAADSRA